MRVLLSTIGSRGDVQPLVALASQLRALGQDVHLCVPPDFREWIEGLGITVTTIGPELRSITAVRPAASSAPPSPDRRRQLAEQTVATQFETIAAAARGCGIIVGATALQIAARSVAEKIGVPYVFAAYAPIVLPSLHHAPPVLPPLPGQPAQTAILDNRELWERDAQRFNDLFGNALNAHRASIGLPPVDDTRSHVLTDRPWLASDPVLAPWPDTSDEIVVQTGAWVLADERDLGHELVRFLDAGDPPIYFGFGSMRAPQQLGEAMVQSARTLERRAIVSRGWADLAISGSEVECLAIGEVNQQALFRRVGAVVHHGGAGTTTVAAMAGAPQVVVPQIYDQHYWAQRVEELGIGVAHEPGMPTAESLAAALERALLPDVAARARSISATIRTDGAHLAARRLIEL